MRLLLLAALHANLYVSSEACRGCSARVDAMCWTVVSRRTRDTDIAVREQTLLPLFAASQTSFPLSSTRALERALFVGTPNQTFPQLSNPVHRRPVRLRCFGMDARLL